MSEAQSIFSQINDFNDNLIANIQGGVIICQFDAATGKSKVIYLSEGWTALTGYTMQELNANFDGNPQALVYPPDGARCNDVYSKQIAMGNRYELEYRFRRKDGRLIWVIDKGVVTRTADGYNQNQSIITDISPIKASEEKLRMSETRFRIAINAAHAAVFEFDIAEKRYIFLDNAPVIFQAEAQDVLAAYEAAPFHKRDFTMEDIFLHWYHPDDVSMLLRLHGEVTGGTIGECDLRVRQPDGSYIWCKHHYATVDDESGTPIRMVGHLVNIDAQHRKTERLLHEAQSDALTGLYNKAAIRDLIEQILADAPQHSRAMLMLDIDNFKGVNDQLGHLFGDAVLMDVAAKLKRLFRNDSVLGRIGGDEFIILLPPACDAQSAAKSAESICDAFRHTYLGEKSDYKISCSIGVVQADIHDSYDTLFHKADLALYQAKALGKDQYVLYTPQLGERSPIGAPRVNQSETVDSGKLKIKERIFELLYDSVDFGGSVNMILALLGQMLDASHIYIYENTPNNTYAQAVYDWCAEGYRQSMPEQLRVPIAAVDYYSYFDENGIFCCNDFSMLSPPLQALYTKSGIAITFQVAIIEDNTVRGFMRYDCVNYDTPPTPEQIEIMTFAAKVTGVFILKKRTDESIKQYNQNKMQALDHVPSAIYVIDEEYRLQYANNLTLQVNPELEIGQKCHDVFMHRTQPCPNCPAAGCSSGPCSTEIYNPYTKIWMIANACRIHWSGDEHMRLVCCQIITQYKEQS